MRKRVDPRVKTLVEHCVLLHQRAFLVIIGDRGAEQVVNLHYLLRQLGAGSYLGGRGSTSSSSSPGSGKKGRCSVLWCYKKDLGFSSHRKKRNKQLKKKMQRGLYDPCRDDPFELFLSSTEIRYCYYKETHAILGSTYTMLVLQDFEALTPNILCRTIETVQGGGLICLLLRSFSSLQQLYGLCMDFHARLRSSAPGEGEGGEGKEGVPGRGGRGGRGGGCKSDTQTAQQQLMRQLHEIQPRFNERFFLSLTRCRNCLIVDDELNVLPLTSFASNLLPLHQHAVAAARAALATVGTTDSATLAAAAAASAAYEAALNVTTAVAENETGKGKPKEESSRLSNKREKETLLRRQQQILADNEKQRAQLRELKQQFKGIPPVGPLVELCVTSDQAKAVLAFLDCLASASSVTSSTTTTTTAAAASVSSSTASGSGGEGVAGARTLGGMNENERSGGGEGGGGWRAAAAATAARRRSVGYETFALTAARGRGKSAALGLAVAAAIAYDYANIFVCSPTAENVKTLFDFIVKGLVALGLKEHVDFSLKREDAAAAAAAAATGSHSSGMPSSSSHSSGFEEWGGEQQLLPGRAAATGGGSGRGKYTGGVSGGGQQHGGLGRLIVGVEVRRRNAQHKQTVAFLPAAAATASVGGGQKDVATTVLHNADLLVIDEAASIPIPSVKALFGPYVVLFSSTVNGYEGTGRALSLKLIQDLKQNRFALQQRATPGTFRCLREISLLTPIRYASGDGVEAWLHDLLCLDATQPAKLSQAALPPAGRCSLYLVDRDALFSYHAAAERFLHALLSLFVSSHYKNSPNDLLLLADAPAHLLFVLLPPIHDAAMLPDIYCAIQVAIEGALSKQAIRQALGRGLRPSGDLLPWTLSQHFVDEDFGCLTGARIVRIACHPSLQRMGYGSAALQQLIEYFEEKNVTIRDPLSDSLAFPAGSGSAVAASVSGGASAVATLSVAATAESEEDDTESNDIDEAGAVEAFGEEEGEEEGREAIHSRVIKQDDNSSSGTHRDILAATATSKCSSQAAKGAGGHRCLSNGETRDSGEETTQGTSSVVLAHRNNHRKNHEKLNSPETKTGESSSPSFSWSDSSSFVPSSSFSSGGRKNKGGDHETDTLCSTADDDASSVAAGGLEASAAADNSEAAAEGAAEAAAVAKKTFVASLSRKALRQRNTLPPLLLPCSSTPPAFCIHYIGVAYGLTAQLFRFWSRKHFIPVYLRHVPTDVTGEHSCIMLRPVISPAAHAAAPPSQSDNDARKHMALHEFLSAHDILRLRKYAQQLADLPLILDILPTLASLFFNDRLPASVALSPLQQAILLAVGAQRKTPDAVATEYNIPYNQTLALLNKTVHKFSSFFQRLQEEAMTIEVERQWGRPTPRLILEGGSALFGELPSQSFAEELQESGKAVNKLQKEELQQLINSFGKNAIGEYSMESISDEDFKAALRGRCPGATPETSTMLSLKRKNFAKEGTALSSGCSSKRSSSNVLAAQKKGAQRWGEEMDNCKQQMKRKRAKA